ncbi:MAG TPA: hypothetical protein VFK54_12230 [Candidatus Limnocylindrales bacterium]|nr:hypothetical protein [Candidatus Limnocylindrales bacterium]
MTGPQTGGRRDALAGIERVIVDGSNVLGVLARDEAFRAGGSSSIPGPPSAIVGRIRGAVPREIRIELVFDGPAAGSPTGRVAEGMSVRYSGRRPGDALIVELAGTAAMAGRPLGSNVLLVTDDRGLSAQVRRHGVRIVGTSWLLRRLERPGSPGGAGGTLGHRKPPRAVMGGTGATEVGSATPAQPGREDPRDAAAEADARRWRPGRHATEKSGPARRTASTPRGLEGRRWKRRGRPAG